MIDDFRDNSYDDDNVDDVSDVSSHELMMPVNTIIIDLFLLSSTSTITTNAAGDCIQHRLHELLQAVNTIIIDLLLISSTSTFTITATTSRRSIQHRIHELLQATECIIMLDGRSIARDGDDGLLETTQNQLLPDPLSFIYAGSSDRGHRNSRPRDRADGPTPAIVKQTIQGP